MIAPKFTKENVSKMLREAGCSESLSAVIGHFFESVDFLLCERTRLIEQMLKTLEESKTTTEEAQEIIRELRAEMESKDLKIAQLENRLSEFEV